MAWHMRHSTKSLLSLPKLTFQKPFIPHVPQLALLYVPSIHGHTHTYVLPHPTLPIRGVRNPITIHNNIVCLCLTLQSGYCTVPTVPASPPLLLFTYLLTYIDPHFSLKVSINLLNSFFLLFFFLLSFPSMASCMYI